MVELSLIYNYIEDDDDHFEKLVQVQQFQIEIELHYMYESKYIAIIGTMYFILR